MSRRLIMKSLLFKRPFLDLLAQEFNNLLSLLQRTSQVTLTDRFCPTVAQLTVPRLLLGVLSILNEIAFGLSQICFVILVEKWLGLVKIIISLLLDDN